MWYSKILYPLFNSKNIDGNETISRLNKDYNETALSYYIGDYYRIKYLVK